MLVEPARRVLQDVGLLRPLGVAHLDLFGFEFRYLGFVFCYQRSQETGVYFPVRTY